jgi:hypothetical protein
MRERQDGSLGEVQDAPQAARLLSPHHCQCKTALSPPAPGTSRSLSHHTIPRLAPTAEHHSCCSAASRLTRPAAQAAQVLAEQGRQHVQAAVSQVHGGAAGGSLTVQQAALRHSTAQHRVAAIE